MLFLINKKKIGSKKKKEFAPYEPSTTDTSSRHYKAGRRTLKYPIYEDLTKDTYNLLQALLKDERTGPVLWTRSWVSDTPGAQRPALSALSSQGSQNANFKVKVRRKDV